MTENAVEAAWDDLTSSGFFEDAGIEIQDVPDDPFNFGQAYHILSINEVREPKVSPTGKFGMYVFFEIIEDRYSNLKPFGRWIQLPTPKAVQLQTGVEFNPKLNPEDLAVVVNFKLFLKALGFRVDEMNQARPNNLQNRQMLAKLWANGNDGRWQINWGFAGLKSMPEAGSDEYNAVMAAASGGSAEGLNELAGGKSGMSGAEAIAAAMREDADS
jgi:hypothetical protein